MNTKHIRFPRKLRCLTLLLLICFLNTMAQKGEPETEFKYLKNSNNSRTLTYSVKIKQDQGESKHAVGISIIFACGENKIAAVNTDFKGIAKCIIASNKELPSEADGKLKFKRRFP